MPILGIIDSGKSGHLVTNNYSSISTVTVGSGGASSITFSSIPSTYTHLQIRAIMRDTNSGTSWLSEQLNFNGDTGNNYSYHALYGGGTSAAAGANTSLTTAYVLQAPQGGVTSNVFQGNVLDILDYANTNKYKTLRNLSGGDANGSGYIGLYSSVWLSTAAVTSITISATTLFAQYSSFALYGIK
jgi:hypothetical protein